jgi:hypothetical protein
VLRQQEQEENSENETFGLEDDGLTVKKLHDEHMLLMLDL